MQTAQWKDQELKGVIVSKAIEEMEVFVMETLFRE